MKKEQFEILMYALYGNNQLFISRGQTIQEWIDNAFDNTLKQGQYFPETTDKHEPLIIEMYKEHLVELYDFAYEQALKTGKVDELKEIDHKINGC